ncbi:MAG: hypothetical protein HRU18_02690 [Pseudoalteromonas sp.]|uniref:hypothetical protein n=1 Tax=Pseudoalteromonas sp. TaxID=53249 RepID=UPI001DBFF86C|nr:hypothetical protein [Pseudoalteromonas sp.]NRA77091.1 hypothetical protein [Pseudoalteromonas sp.]
MEISVEEAAMLFILAGFTKSLTSTYGVGNWGGKADARIQLNCGKSGMMTYGYAFRDMPTIHDITKENVTMLIDIALVNLEGLKHEQY